MSEQILQFSTVAIKDLSLLSKACKAIEIPNLGCKAQLYPDRKSARFYNGRMDKCDAVIGFSRELTKNEQGSYYEISVKLNPKTKTYELHYDAAGSDRGIYDRGGQICQAYLGQELRKKAKSQGARSIKEFETPSKPGWRRLVVEVPA